MQGMKKHHSQLFSHYEIKNVPRRESLGTEPYSPHTIPVLEKQKKKKEKRGGGLAPWLTPGKLSSPVVGAKNFTNSAGLLARLGGSGLAKLALGPTQIAAFLIVGGTAGMIASGWLSGSSSQSFDKASFPSEHTQQPIVLRDAPAQATIGHPANSLSMFAAINGNRSGYSKEETILQREQRQEEKYIKDAITNDPVVEKDEATNNPKKNHSIPYKQQLKNLLAKAVGSTVMGGSGGALGGSKELKPSEAFGMSNLGFTKKKFKVKEKAKKKRKLIPIKIIHKKRGKSGRAMGQLKLTNNLSRTAIGETNDNGAHSFAADAFEQTSAIGQPGQPIGISGLESSAYTGLETGPSTIQPSQSAIPARNVTPYQPDVNKAQNESNTAKILMIMGAILLGMGTMLAALGMHMMNNPFTIAEGKVLLVIGLGMVAGGITMIAVGMSQGQSAKSRGNKIASQSGQQEQGRVINECADQATGKQNCAPQPIRAPKSTVQEDVAAERNATFSF